MAKSVSKSGCGGALVVFCFPALFVAVGIFLGCLSIPMWRLYYRSAHWDRVEVTVTKAFWELKGGISGHRTRVYHAEYDFSYTGRRWHGTQINITGQYPPEEFDSICDEAEHEASHQRAWKGYKVLAWVNPADPSESLLYRQVDRAMWGLPLGSAAFAGFGALFGTPLIVRAMRQRRASAGQNVYADPRV